MTDDSDSNISSDGDDASMKADDEDPPLHLGNPMEDEGLCSPSNKKAILQKSISTLITGMVTTSVFQRFQKNAVVDVDAHQNEKIIAIVDSRTRTNELVDKILKKKNCATNIRGDNTMDESKSDIDGKKRQNLLEVSRTRLSERNF